MFTYAAILIGSLEVIFCFLMLSQRAESYNFDGV